MDTITINTLAEHITKRLAANINQLKDGYNTSKDAIGFFYLDDILPIDIAKQCFDVFPDKSKMRCLKSLREYKYVSAQMNKHHPLLEKVIYAFQHQSVVNIISEICDVNHISADQTLYAGGLSLMADQNFLNPHLDNSHDANRALWRVFNLLYYVTPDWELQDGGHLELWPKGPKGKPRLIESKFNRLIVMATHDKSWHSVNKVTTAKSARCCISNYYFSSKPLSETDTFHVTKFRGRPHETFKNIILDADAKIRMLVRKVFKKGVRKNPHVYKKHED